eukprot:6205619-Pleurochrysis_carterae.AAC.3
MLIQSVSAYLHVHQFDLGCAVCTSSQSAKGEAMRQMVRSSFKANLLMTDTAEISKLKMRAILGIQNYVIHESTRYVSILPSRLPAVLPSFCRSYAPRFDLCVITKMLAHALVAPSGSVGDE